MIVKKYDSCLCDKHHVIYIGCFYCHHKVECHSDANEGKGLRAFNYAKSKVYLTKVVKEPKVEEIKIDV